jgi:ATP-dependent DNA ligase
MLTRDALEWTARFGPIATAAARLKARTAYLNGEIVVLDDAGISLRRPAESTLGRPRRAHEAGTWSSLAGAHLAGASRRPTAPGKLTD